MIDIEDVKRLTIEPNDILVIQFKDRISSDTADRMKAYLSDKHPILKNKIMVIDGDAKLAVLNAKEAEILA